MPENWPQLVPWGGVALAEHIHHQHQNQPQPQPPPEHHHSGAAAAGAAGALGALGVILADQYLQQHSNPPPANLPAPPVDPNPAIPILPIPINNPSWRMRDMLALVKECNLQWSALILTHRLPTMGLLL